MQRAQSDGNRTRLMLAKAAQWRRRDVMMDWSRALRIVHFLGFPGIVLPPALRLLVDLEFIAAPSDAAFLDLAARADAIVLSSPSYTPAVAALLARPGNTVRWIHFASAGYETASALVVPADIRVTNSSPAWAPIVAEHSVALLLALCRRLPELERDRQLARWERGPHQAGLRALETMTIGILGYGAIGKEIGKRLAGFSCRSIAIVRRDQDTPHAEPARLATALPRLDALLVTLPLTAGTRGLIGAPEIANMKPGGFLINVGRGGPVDQAALIAALHSGHLAGAALDVFEPEPPPRDDPIWTAPNLIVSPHLAGFGGSAGLARLLDLLAENILRFRDGRALLHQVDPARD